MVEDKNVWEKIKKLKLKIKNISSSNLSGNYHSIFKGSGDEFHGLRAYTYGDNYKDIDWKASSRFWFHGNPQSNLLVKEFVEERDLEVYIVLDKSSSLKFGSNVSKEDTAVEIAASIAYTASQNNDKVGLILFSEGILDVLPPKRGDRQLQIIFKYLNTNYGQHIKTNLNKSLKDLSKILDKKSVLFIVSDFDSEDFYESLKILKNKHDIIAIMVTDEREKKLPDIGLIELEDIETGEQILIDTSKNDFRNQYEGLVERKYNKTINQFKQSRVDLITFLSGQEYVKKLNSFFELRKHKMVR